MDLYLVQHGEAKKEQDDAARPLTDAGRREVEAVARLAAKMGLDVAIVCHSGKLRAQQTAEALAAHLEPRMGCVAMAGLGPKDDPTPAARAIDQATEPRLVVGHLPHLARLAGLLLAGDMEREVVAFRMGAIVCLSQGEAGWRLRWILTPEIARALGR